MNTKVKEMIQLNNRLSLPVHVSEHFPLSLVFLALGFFLTCWLLLYKYLI